MLAGVSDQVCRVVSDEKPGTCQGWAKLRDRSLISQTTHQTNPPKSISCNPTKPNLL